MQWSVNDIDKTENVAKSFTPEKHVFIILAKKENKLFTNNTVLCFDSD